MLNKGLNRFGDTAFRIKHQVNFYLNIINWINEDNITSLEDLCKKIKQENFLNYKNIDISRIKFLTKQLKNFNLIEEDKKLNFKTTKLFKKIISIVNNNSHEFSSKNIDIVKVLFGLLMMNDKSLNEEFKSLIEYLNDEEQQIKNIIALFAICESKKEFDNLKNYSEANLINFIFNEIPETDVIDFIKDKISIKDLLNKNNYEMRKPYKEIDDIKRFINFLENNPSIQDIKIFLDEKESLKRCINKIKRNTKIDYEDFLDYKYKFLELFLKLKKNELIFKDYFDINSRWFLNIGLFENISNGNSKKFCVSKKYLKIFKLLLDFDIEKLSVETLKEKLFNINGLNEIKTKSLKYPYDLPTTINALKELRENCNYSLICEKLEIEDVSEPTLFEYLVNLSFSLSYGYSPCDFKNKYSNTLLDDDLKPRLHARGKQSDGLIEDLDIDYIFATIESTILRNKELHREKESIQRHALDLFETSNTKYNNDQPNCLFVIKNEIDENSIIKFSSFQESSYVNDYKKLVRIIILDLNMLITILEKDKLVFLLRRVINKLPFINEEQIFDIREWYTNLITDI